MKDLDLSVLKNSRHEKHKKIYEKAMRIINAGHQTKQYSDQEIVDMAKKFPRLSVDVKAHGDVFVRSLKDTWVIRDEDKYFTLHHRSVKFEYGRVKEIYHVQDVYWDLEYLFASIVSHDDFAVLSINREPEEVNDIVRACLTA